MNDPVFASEKCPTCDGTGEYSRPESRAENDYRCRSCGGTGTLEVFEPFVAAGEVVRLREERDRLRELLSTARYQLPHDVAAFPLQPSGFVGRECRDGCLRCRIEKELQQPC